MKKSIGVSALMNLIMIVGLINPDYANADIKNTNLQESTMQVENTVWGKDSNISYEEYVINLLRDMGQNATIDRWRENLTFLKKHYNEIINEKNGSKSVIDYYISEYEREHDAE